MAKDLDYTFAVAKIKANERYMLSSSDIEALILSESVSKAISYLVSHKWVNAGESDSIVSVIEKAEKNLWNLLSESVPDKNELEVFTVENDFFNIKAALKCSFSGLNCDDYFLYPTSLDTEILKDAVSKKDFSLIKNEYAEALAVSFDALNKAQNGQRAEFIIDKAALETMIKKAESSKCEMLLKITEFFVGVCNIKIAYKAIKNKLDGEFVKEAFVKCKSIDVLKLQSLCKEDLTALVSYLKQTDYKKAAELMEADILLFEKWCDDKMLEIASGSNFEFFGFAPICGYYYKKVSEIKKVKSILLGKEKGFSENEIRERVKTLNG